MVLVLLTIAEMVVDVIAEEKQKKKIFRIAIDIELIIKKYKPKKINQK